MEKCKVQPETPANKCNRPPTFLILCACMSNRTVLMRLTRSLAPSILFRRAELWFLAAQQGPHRNGLIQLLAVSRHLFRGECVQLRIGLADLFLLKVLESNQSEPFPSLLLIWDFLKIAADERLAACSLAISNRTPQQPLMDLRICLESVLWDV